MNITFWKLWKFIQKYYKSFYGRPKIPFNFEKQHGSDGKNIEYENEKELEVTYLNNEDASFIFKDLEKFL